MDHIVRPNSDSKEVVARWVCGQEEEENIEVELEDETENASRTVKKIQDFRKPSKKEHAARNDTFSPIAVGAGIAFEAVESTCCTKEVLRKRV